LILESFYYFSNTTFSIYITGVADTKNDAGVHTKNDAGTGFRGPAANKTSVAGVMDSSFYDADEWEEETIKTTTDIGTAPSAVTSNIDVPNFVGVPSPLIKTPPANIKTPPAKSAGKKSDGPQSKRAAAFQSLNVFSEQPNSPSKSTLKASSPLSKRVGLKYKNNIVEKNKQGNKDELEKRRDKARDDKRKLLLEKRAAFDSAEAEPAGLPLDAKSPIGSCFEEPSTEGINKIEFNDSD
jgi:hypothetical protein